jgi:uncharacterized surface protein with fasciclin (FAS1) repeats
MKRTAFHRAIAVAAIVGAATIGVAPASSAAMSNNSLVSVLTGGPTGLDADAADYDILTAAVQAVLTGKPDSSVKVLADGTVPLTAFLPTDQAFINLVTALTGSRPASEEATFNTVAGLGLDTVEQILLYHVVPGKAIASGAALKANGAALKTALPGKVIKVKVTKAPSIILGDYNTALRNPRVILGQVDINKGSAQIAHGINAVLLPSA